MPTLYTNNVAALTAAAVGPSDTIILLSAGQGAKFPAPASNEWFWATVIHPVSFEVEVVQVTSRSADSLTVVRGRDNTAAIAFPPNAAVEMRLVAQMMREVSWQLVAGASNGLAQLDAATRVPIAQMPLTVSYLDNTGRLPANVMPSGYQPQSFYDSWYPILTQTNTFNGQQNFNNDVAIGGVLQVGGATGRIGIGNDATIVDVDRSNTLAIIGNGAPEQGYWQFGNAGATLGFTGGGFVAAQAGVYSGTLQPLWWRGNFDPDSKANVVTPRLYDLRVRDQSGNTAVGTIFFGETGAYQTFSGANFGFSHVAYGPNFIATSDESLKKSIRKAPAVKGIGDLIELISWEWRKRGKYKSPGRHHGVSAQKVQKYAPHLVHEQEDGCLGVDKAGLALEATVDNAARIRVLEEEIRQLKALLKKRR